MVFPETPLPINAELFIGDEWVEVKTSGDSDIRLDDGITISRGRRNEQGRVGPSTCTFKLDNRTGKYSNRNPLSPYYRLIPLNTPFRVGVATETAHVEVRHAPYGAADSSLPGPSSASRITTPDSAANSITGDIDVRIDVEPDHWNTGNTRGVNLAGKYVLSSDQRSWLFSINPRGYLHFFWSPNGTFASRLDVTSTERIPESSARLALRVTLDVNNGSGGNTVNFYTAPTIDGSWTQLGLSVVTSGTTSIYNSTSALEVCSVDNGNEDSTVTNPGWNAISNPSYDSFAGKVYGFELYNGIAGTKVADLDATTRSEGDTSWSDGLGNTWTCQGEAVVSQTDRRFIGELSAMPIVAVQDTDVYIRATASGVIRRITQGAKKLRSPLFRHLHKKANKTGYWPLEDGYQATYASSDVLGARSALVNDMTFLFDESFPASDGVARINSTASRIRGQAKVGPDALLDTYFTLYFKYPSIPASDTVLATVYCNGALVKWQIVVNSTSFVLRGYDGSGSLVINTSAVHTSTPPTDWIAMRLLLSKSGANIDPLLSWYRILDPVVVGFDAGNYSGSLGAFQNFEIMGDAINADLSIAHIFMGNEAFELTDYDFLQSSNAYVNEPAGLRARRLSIEEGVPFEWVGDITDTEPMGPQRPDTYMNLMYEASDVDGGFLYESRYRLGIGMRTRKSMYNRIPIELDYSASVLTGELQPPEDDQSVRNRVTVSRPFGGEATHAVSEGTYSEESYPDGVGKYESAVALSPSSDDRLEQLAAWQTLQGTWDEMRFPTIQVDLERTPFLDDPDLVSLIRLMDLGSAMRITNTPFWLPPNDIDLLVQGYKELLRNRGWRLTWNTTPYGPYIVNDLTQSDQSVFRAAGSNSSLNADITSSATSFDVKTPNGVLWRTSASRPGNFPIDIVIGGELIEISSISGSSSPQTFTVGQRAKNGTVKSHSANDPVQVAKPFRPAL